MALYWTFDWLNLKTLESVYFGSAIWLVLIAYSVGSPGFIKRTVISEDTRPL